MSKKRAEIPLDLADELTSGFVKTIKRHCLEVVVAGDVRLRCPAVQRIHILYEADYGNNKIVAALANHIQNGDFKIESLNYAIQCFKLVEYGDLDVTLWLHDNHRWNTRQWGRFLVQVTGNRYFADYVRGLIVRRIGTGARIHSGAWWDGDRLIPMPEEKDVFRFCGLPSVIPMEVRREWEEGDTWADVSRRLKLA